MSINRNRDSAVATSRDAGMTRGQVEAEFEETTQTQGKEPEFPK